MIHLVEELGRLKTPPRKYNNNKKKQKKNK